MRAINTRRRQKDRQYPKAEHAAWSKDKSATAIKADVINKSETGVCLRVSAGQSPHLGDCIQVISRNSVLPRNARVIRLEDNQSGSVRIGCRWISSDDSKKRSAGRRRPRVYRRHT